PNDMFCAGHLQLPDGNAMFVGGTQYYFPYRTGANTSYIFDWRAELDIDWQGIDWRFPWKGPNNPWVFSGLMKRGRWYPTLVPLLDGRFAIFSGFVGFDKGFPEMYQFEINHYVEFFDPYAFAAGGAQQAWKALDVKNTTNSPFDTRLPNPTHPDVCLDMEFFDELGIDPELGERVPCECPIRCQEAYQKDAFKLYPHNYLYEGNRIYLTREGDWVSLRTADTKWMRRTKFTYWMEVGGDAENPKVSFERGPDRPDIVTSYGTTFQIPDTDKIALLGGQPISAGTRLPLGATVPNHFVGGRGSAKLEIFDPKADRGQGAWTEDPDFLGDQFQDDRTMHYGITLPTKQVLVINGANYDFYGAVLFPIMLTPQYNRQGEMTGYSQQRMAEAVEPRLYHNTAILLPDGRVWVSGGNSARATVSLEKTPPKDPLYAGQPLPNPDLVELDVYFFTDGTMAKQQPGSNVTPTENWTAEIFSPPYLYIDGDRRAEIKGLTGSARDGATFESKIGEKTYYLLQSDQQYQVALEGLPSNPFTEEQSLVLIKLPSATHGGEWGQKFVELEITGSRGSSVSFRTPNMQEGNLPPGYYMLFYVDRMGKPSVAQMVRFDDKADAP
ncbi:MAG: galactose oxidase early set domain-containing protein, partial [Bacteroidota bacterium]